MAPLCSSFARSATREALRLDAHGGGGGGGGRLSRRDQGGRTRQVSRVEEGEDERGEGEEEGDTAVSSEQGSEGYGETDEGDGYITCRRPTDTSIASDR